MLKKPLLPRWLWTLLLLVIGCVALVGSFAIADSDLVARVTLAVIGIVAFVVGVGTDGQGDTLGSPRYRRLRAFNPSKKRLKRVRAKAVIPPEEPDPEWPKPVLRDVPEQLPPEQPAEKIADPLQFHFDVKEVKVEIDAVDPNDLKGTVQSCAFHISAPEGSIEELEVLVHDVDNPAGRLKAIACVYCREAPNEELVRSAPVEHIF